VSPSVAIFRFWQVHAEERAETGRPFMRRLTTVATIAVSMGLVGATASMRAGGQYAPPPQRCNLTTLQGAYGLQWIGTRPAANNPAVIETFTGVAIRTFDGAGTFTQVSNVKGTESGVGPENIESVGTYEVNEDCSGTASSQFSAGAPIVTIRFVIVDDGDEVLYSVMTPLPFFNAGVLKKVHSR
jgi:hypothetical protein